MSQLSLEQMTRDMEDHLGIDCMEYTGLTSVQRLTVILFEVCRHIPKHTGEKKGQVKRSPVDGVTRLTTP